MTLIPLNKKGKQGIKGVFTRSMLEDIVEDMIAQELDRQKPRHKRGKERDEKDADDREADEERNKLADLTEEQRGSSNEVEMDDEDMSEESMDKIVSKDKKDEGKKKPSKKS